MIDLKKGTMRKVEKELQSLEAHFKNVLKVEFEDLQDLEGLNVYIGDCGDWEGVAMRKIEELLK